MADTITTLKLGYGGKALINGVPVLATSGSFTNSVTPSYNSAYEMPNDDTSRSRVLHADGTVTHSGSLGFDMTIGALSVLESLLARNQKFSVEMYDGQYGMKMGSQSGTNGCVADSISISGSPGGFITASLSFQCIDPPTKLTTSASNMRDSHISDVIPYWWSGNSYVRDWTFSFSQTVTPKFVNKNRYQMISEGILASSPVYLFVGEIQAGLEFQTFCPLVTDSVYIASERFKIIGRTSSTGYAIAGLNELPSYRYSIQSSAIGRNNENILTIG